MSASFQDRAASPSDLSPSGSSQASIPSAVLAFSGGTVEARVGDRFGWWDGTVWEIVSFKSDRTYSPSGFGGTPTVVVRHLHGQLTPHMAKYMEGDCTDWCGDSVGAGLSHYTRAKGFIPDHLAQGMAARSDETAQQAQPVGQQPGPKDAPDA